MLSPNLNDLKFYGPNAEIDFLAKLEAQVSKAKDELHRYRHEQVYLLLDDEEALNKFNAWFELEAKRLDKILEAMYAE